MTNLPPHILRDVIRNPSTRPDVRAGQRITEPVAAQMTGADRQPFLTRVRVNNETVVLDQHDCATLRQQFASAQRAVVGCRKHEQSIKCACLASWREWYYALQRQSPNSPLALAGQNLWDLVERFSQEYERPKDLNPELRAILETIGNQNSGEPDWFSRRSELGIQNQKANAARRKSHDYR